MTDHEAADALINSGVFRIVHGDILQVERDALAGYFADNAVRAVKEERRRIAAILKDNSDAYQRRADSTSWYAKETNQEVANVLSEFAAELEKEPT